MGTVWIKLFNNKTSKKMKRTINCIYKRKWRQLKHILQNWIQKICVYGLQQQLNCKTRDPNLPRSWRFNTIWSSTLRKLLDVSYSMTRENGLRQRKVFIRETSLKILCICTVQTPLGFYCNAKKNPHNNLFSDLELCSQHLVQKLNVHNTALGRVPCVFWSNCILCRQRGAP